MLIYLYRDSRDGTVHGSENKKSTGCRVNLQKPENITRYTAAGNAEDELAVLDKVTCSKCQTLFLKKMMKADSKERAQQAKEEKRKGKNAVDDANMVNLAEAQEQKRIEAEKARRHAEIAERQRQERLQREEEDKRRAEEEAKRRAEEAARRPQPAPAPHQSRNCRHIRNMCRRQRRPLRPSSIRLQRLLADLRSTAIWHSSHCLRQP